MVLARLNTDGILIGYAGTPLFRKSAANGAGGLYVPFAASGDSDAAIHGRVISAEAKPSCRRQALCAVRD